jgi:hypothetical protein
MTDFLKFVQDHNSLCEKNLISAGIGEIKMEGRRVFWFTTDGAKLFAHVNQKGHSLTDEKIDVVAVDVTASWVYDLTEGKMLYNGLRHVDSFPWSDGKKIWTDEALPLFVDYQSVFALRKDRLSTAKMIQKVLQSESPEEEINKIVEDLSKPAPDFIRRYRERYFVVPLTAESVEWVLNEVYKWR